MKQQLRLVRFAEGCKRLGIGKSTAYRKLATDPDFPRIVKPLGKGTKPSGFIEQELDAYILRQRGGQDAA